MHRRHWLQKILLLAVSAALALASSAPAQTAAPAPQPALGVYGENSMQRVLDFEKWLRHPVDLILCTVDFQKWENYRYADWLSQTVYGARGHRRLVYDVPIIITGATYAAARAGDYDAHWQCLADSLIANNPGAGDIVIRPSHEMNGDWFPWGVGGTRQAHIPDFIASWQRFHRVFRSVKGGHRFRFSFSTSEGATDPRPMWPGDAYVDIVGHDLYWKPKAMGGEGWETDDPQEAWSLRIRTDGTGYNAWNLAGMHTFARTHGKPFQIDEWGVWGPRSTPFIQSLAAWLKANHIPSHTYWDSDAAYPGQLSTRPKEWPTPTAAFQQAFGKKLQ